MNGVEKNINAGYVRKSYDTLLEKLSTEDYKNYRWFKNEAAFQQYKQTKALISELNRSDTFKNVLEIGCGPGTWTEFLSKKYGNIVALDISKGMLEQAKKNIKDKNVTFMLGDFLDDSIIFEHKFDVIYSIRSFEYFSNKEKAINRAKNLLKDGGALYIITKNPKYFPKFVIDFLARIGLIKNNSKFIPERFRNLINVYSDKLHSDWISADKLKKIMKREKFKDIQIYPVVIGLSYSGTIWKIFTLIHSKIRKIPVNSIIIPLMESYLIIGIKYEQE